MSNIYKQALDKWGVDAQMTVTIEEMAELTKEICKCKRGQFRPEFIEELVDVEIMIEQLKAYINLSGLINTYIEFKEEKLHRLEVKINE